MPYTRRSARGAQLDGFTDTLKNIVGDVAGVVRKVEGGAQQVQAIASTVAAQAPRVQAIIGNPRAAYGGAAVTAQAAASGLNPFVLAIGAGLLVAGIVHVVRKH